MSTINEVYELSEHLQAQSPECYSEGECLQSTSVGATNSPNEEQCNRFCLSIEDCAYFTYYEGESLCVAYSNCQQFSTDTCNSKCTTSRRGCLQCGFSGQCDGTLLDLQTNTQSEDECIRFCRFTQGCNIYSFVPSSGFCLALGDCSSVDETACSDCLTGQRDCKYTFEGNVTIIHTQ